MNGFKASLAAIISLWAGCVAHPRPEIEVFPAPEGSKKYFETSGVPVDRVYAEVLTWRSESAIAVVAESAKHPGWPVYLSKSDYFSPDANQGQVVIGISWSPDGRFLAYQTLSSGGHQPYHATILVWDLETEDETDLQDLLGREWHEWVPEICWVTSDGGLVFSWAPEGFLRFYAVCNSLEEFREFRYDPVARSYTEVHREPLPQDD